MVIQLVLSVYPGLDLLGMGFELEGFTVVRGGDPLFGQLGVENFHPPPDVFAGVIGGPPCQWASQLRYLNPLAGQREGNLIPEFCRVVQEAQPDWWLMENVPTVPREAWPEVEGYQVYTFKLNARWIGMEQNRLRQFWFGSRDGWALHPAVALFEQPLRAVTILAGHGEAPGQRDILKKQQAILASSSNPVPVKLGGSGKVKSTYQPATVCSGHGPTVGSSGVVSPRLSLEEMAQLQGYDWMLLRDAPFTAEGKRKLLGNAVPLQVARALAKAVKEVLGV